MLIAVTRPISASMAQCQLTHLPRTPIDIRRAIAEHAAYEAALETLRVKVRRAAAAPDLPDAVFVEDTAVVVDEAAVITRPGAEPRRAETAGVAAILGEYRPLLHMEPPATLDGGDVLRIGKTLYVGRSSRTNHAGIETLRKFLSPLGYHVRGIEVDGCLHLKSAVTQVADHMVLLNPAWVDRRLFSEMDCVEIDPDEPLAANALWLNNVGPVVYPAHFPRTRARLEKRGVSVVAVSCAELAKAEGAVTCCCVLVNSSSSSSRFVNGPLGAPTR